MGWLRLVGSLKLQVSFAEYRLFYRALLQKRPAILSSLLIVATPYLYTRSANCTTLGHTAAPCNTMQHTATRCRTCITCNILQHTATHCNTLQHTATHCNTLQHTSTCAIAQIYRSVNLYTHSANCTTLQHIATHCNTLQHTATPCNTLQHPATHVYQRHRPDL